MALTNEQIDEESINGKIDPALFEGYEKFEELRKNLKGIFEKIHEMKNYEINIDYYEKALQKIEEDFDLEDGILQSHEILSDAVRRKYSGWALDFEVNSLRSCNDALQELTNDFNNNITPIYNVYHLFTTIDKELVDYNNFNIEASSKIIDKLIELVDQINSFNTAGRVEVTKLVEKAYKTIYDGLLYEAVFGKHKVLNHIKEVNLDVNREYLGEIIRNETKELIQCGKITSDEVSSEYLNNISEGPGYDFLSANFINKLSNIRFGSLVARYNDVQQKEKNSIELEYQKLQEDRKALKVLRTVQKLAIYKLNLGKAALRVKACSYLLVPFIAVGAGGIVGKMLSDNITEYATTTRKYDFETDTEIGIPKVEYDDRETSYVASVDVYEPWQEKPGGGYIRNVTSYEFEATAIEGKYHLTKDDIQKNLREIYTVSEVKNKLELGDSMTETSIIITETFQDKNDSRISTKYIGPFAIGSGVIALVVEALAFHLGIIRSFKRKNQIQIDGLDGELFDAIKDYERVKKELSGLDTTESNLQERANEFEKNYGIKINVKQMKRSR